MFFFFTFAPIIFTNFVFPYFPKCKVQQGQGKKIILTDEFFKLLDTPFRDNFSAETEARWNLVETAWELGVSRNLLNVHYDDHSKLFFVNSSLRRKDVTSARDALNGYQKGKCFYCFDDFYSKLL